jgi:hypothetical protein
MIQLNAAHTELETAKARFTADEMKMVAWREANPEPKAKRARKRYVRKSEEIREATVRDSWNAELAAEHKFHDARIAVANVVPRDHHDMFVKAAASVAYDSTLTASYQRNGIIGYAVAGDFFKQNMA